MNVIVVSDFDVVDTVVLIDLYKLLVDFIIEFLNYFQGITRRFKQY